jgi:hypothetical protein
VSLTSTVIYDDAGGRGEVGALERGCWFGGRGSVIVARLHRWDAVALGPRQHGNIPPGRRTTTTCASLLAAGLFIDSQNLIGDGASLDLAMEEARHLFQRASWWRWSVATAASFGECRKT